MNYSMIRYMLGLVSCFSAMFMTLPMLVSVIYKEKSGFSFLAVALFSLAVGILTARKKPQNRKMYAREGLVIVALSWIVLSIYGALPFALSGDIPSYVDALFETISGFTTTGASILTDVEALSNTCLFWRSFTHWIGGMGVLVFIMALMPAKDSSSMHIMRAESPGPSVSKLVPQVRNTAMILYLIYFGMTLVEITLLLIGGMPLFDAVTVAFGTAGTGGFAVKNSSIAGYSVFLQRVVAVFMVMFGVNFNVYFVLLRKKPRQAFRSVEFLTYIGIVLGSSLLIAISILPMFPNAFTAFHQAFFQVGSIMTTTGYATADFNTWPALARTILVMLMFVGACAGSTGGGIKVSRVILLLKGIKKELQMVCHPRSVKKVKVDGHVVEHEVIRSVNAFMVLYVVIFVVSLLIVSLDEKDLVTNFTAVAATLNNIGPGLEIVGPTGNFSSFSILSKFVLMFDMLAGRLELFPIMMLFVPATWKRV